MIRKLALAALLLVPLTAQAQESADWKMIFEVVSHPRCANCHTDDQHPRWIDEKTKVPKFHGMNVQRGADGMGNPGLRCVTCQQASNSKAEMVWVDEQWLLNQNVAPWSDLPLWIPTSDPDYLGFSRMNCAKAIATGLRSRPMTETVRDTLAWHATRNVTELKAGLKPERENELLAKWAAER